MASIQQLMLQKIAEVVNRSDYRVMDDSFHVDNGEGVVYRFSELNSFDVIFYLSIKCYPNHIEFYVKHYTRATIKASFGDAISFDNTANSKFNELLDVIEKNLAR